jgi:hypothetical protein
VRSATFWALRRKSMLEAGPVMYVAAARSFKRVETRS